MLLFVVTLSFAQAEKETSKVNLAVMQGPTGFSSVMLPDNINILVLSSPNEAVAKLINGELDMAVLPANTAANVYNKGIKIKALAIVGEGMLSVLGTNENAKEISVPGAGGTPDHMASLLYPEYEKNYSVTAPAQVAQLLIAGKCELAILPQPFVNMVISKNNKVEIIKNVQEDWANLTGSVQYPMSVLVARSGYVDENEQNVKKVMQDYKQSISKVLSSTHEAALIIEEKGIMKADLAEESIKDCALAFVEGQEAKEELETYYKILLELAPEAIGNKLPDSYFYE